MISSKKWNTLCILIILGMCVIMLFCSKDFFRYYEGEPWGVLFRSILYCSMAICLILFISTTADQRINVSIFFFMCQISTVFLCMFLELESWFVKCHYGGDDHLFWIYTLEDMLFPIRIWFFSQYQRSVLNVDAREYRVPSLIINILLSTMVLLALLNCFTKQGFTIENLVFIEGPMYFHMYLIPILMIVICILTTFRYAKTKTQMIVFTIYVLAPILAMAYKFPSYSASLTYTISMGSFLLMYGSIYLDRGMEIVRHQATITEQKVALMVSRIEPRFLKESAEAISDMKDVPEETKKALSMFAEYIENNVDTVSLKEPVPVKDELNHIITYTKLEKLRFKDKLNIHFDVRDMDFLIPPMTLQIIVENAIKHGVTQRSEEGTVNIKIWTEGEEHLIEIADDGVGFDTHAPLDDSRSHIGLSIISFRLEEMCKGTLDVQSTLNKGTVVTIRMPRQK